MRFSVVYWICLGLTGIEGRTSYDSFKVYQVTPKSLDQAKLLKEFENDNNFDFWSELRIVNAPVDIMVSPRAQNEFVEFLKSQSIEYEVLINNVEEKVQEEINRQRISPRVARGEVTFTEFMRYDDIVAYVEQLAVNYPNIVTTEVIGRSFEGRNITSVRISSGGSNKTTIFAEATIHAREWIAPPVALYVINQLVENIENAHMYQDVDWVVIPVANPDGYEYTHTNTRFWRKTRTIGTICSGVDPNRNFDYQWRVIGASAWQCDETYAGYKPFSEVETQALRDYTLKHKDEIKLYLAIHSYGQWMLFPWGYTSEEPEDAEDLVTLGELFKDAVYAVNETEYVVGTTANALYFAAGTDIDWAKAVAGIKFAYTIELPRGGSTGFDIPADRIVSVVEETWEGFKALHSYIRDRYVNV